MTKKIMVCTINAQGHYQPLVPFIRELVSARVEVDIVIPGAAPPALAETGSKTHEIFSSIFEIQNAAVPSEATTANIVDVIRARNIDDAITALPSMISLCGERMPDLLLYDKMCMSARVAAAHWGIKAAAIHPFYCAPHLMPEGHPIFGPPSNAQAAAAIQDQLERMRRITRAAPKTVSALLSDDEERNLVFLTREFHPFGEELQGNYQFLGPQLEDAPPARTASRDTIYVSLGTLFGTGQEAFFRDCAEVLSGTPYKVVLSVGSRVDIRSIAAKYDNVSVHNHVDQAEVLSRAALFVTHGGMNSVQDAIWAQVPMAVFPQGFDQFVTARRVEELNCGLNFAGMSDIGAAVRDALARLVGSAAVSEGLRRQREYAQNAGGTARAAQEILRLA